eukprot:3809367-Rhodomonas_salina.1
MACEAGSQLGSLLEAVAASSPSRTMTSSHAKIEEYGTHGAVVQWLWHQAEYGSCPVGVVHMRAQWQGHF